MPELSDRDREILQFETDHPVWGHVGAKLTVVYDRWQLTETRYYQVLHSLLERPEALVAFPQTVRRLTRLRDVRRHARSRSRLGDA